MKFIYHVLLGIAVTGLSLSEIAHAQTTAIWTGPSSGGEWNTGGNWSTASPPLDVTTNAYIGAGTNVNYNLPMSAASFGILTNNGSLNINASGFNCSAIYMVQPSVTKVLNITNAGAAVTLSTDLNMGTNTVAILGVGASLSVRNLMVGYNAGNNTITSSFTNNGGTLTALKTALNNSSSGTITPLLVINGGNNNLGNTSVGRAHNSSVYTLGLEGLVIYGGTVTMTNLTVSGASFGSAYVAGGTVTNIGNVTITGSTAGRYMRVVQGGGLFVVSDPNIIYLNPTTAGSETARYQVTGGTNFIGGIYLGASNNTAAATVTATVGGIVYVGSQGIATNGAVINTFTMNNGGVFGATADWIDSVSMNLNGASAAFTWQTADPTGTAHNITVNGVLTGGGQAAFMKKTGAGILTMNAANTYLGTTLIKEGTLALGASGSLASTPILVGSGATFDVNAVSGGYSIPAGKTLGGFGTVNGPVSMSGSAVTDPGSNSLNGTLTFSSSVTEGVGATNHFDLTGTPGPGNDMMVINGDFNVSGVNYIDIRGGSYGSVYPLIQYGGNFNGDVTANFVVTGAAGVLSNDVVTKTIYLTSQNTVRAPTNIVWVGNSSANDWDVNTTTNWLAAGQLTFFMSSDSAIFDDTGAANSAVNVAASVSPDSTTVNSAANYSFSGTGSIDGSGTLTKGGSGTLTILNANGYTGGTTINGGILEVPSLANGGTASPIGASVSDPVTLIITNATLRYTGSTVAIDRAATLGGTATLDVTNSASTLTISGSLSGSGALTKAGAGGLTLSAANSFPGGTVLNAGTLTLNNASAAGSGFITFNGNSTLAIGAVVPGNTIVLSNYNGVITGGNAGGSTGINGVTGSSNLLLAVTTGVFDLKGGMSSYSGTITFSNAGGATVRFNGCTGSSLATWDLGTGTMDLNIRSGSTSNNIGALKGGSGTTLSGRGGSSNNGGTTYYIGANGLDTVFAGVIQNGAGGSSSTTGINKVGSGTLTLSGASTYTGTTTVSSGILALGNNGADGSINGSTMINIVSGAVFDVTGRSDGTFQLGSSTAQLLEGRGTINGSLNAQASGTVAPGGGPGGSTGTLTVTNTITLGGTTWMKLNRTNSQTSDRIVSSTAGIINYGGTLVVTNIGGKLQPGDTFTLFSGTTLNGGSFANIILPHYYSWVTNLTVDGTIQVAGILPPPSIANVDLSTLLSGSITLNATAGAPGGTLAVLTSTNVALPVSQWTTVATGTFDASGNYSGSVTADPNAPQQFYLIEGF